VEWHEGAGRAGEIKEMTATTERTQIYAFGRRRPAKTPKLKGELNACEKENKSLNDLVGHIGETIIRPVRANG
jgi:hypothetical protein